MRLSLAIGACSVAAACAGSEFELCPEGNNTVDQANVVLMDATSDEVQGVPRIVGETGSKNISLFEDLGFPHPGLTETSTTYHDTEEPSKFSQAARNAAAERGERLLVTAQSLDDRRIPFGRLVEWIRTAEDPESVRLLVARRVFDESNGMSVAERATERELEVRGESATVKEGAGDGKKIVIERCVDGGARIREDVAAIRAEIDGRFY
ncbi:hypothetical protein COV82_03605 [Candidatus Peregrinibacteria bacterium CG11_big_fil_rev_8_21_14_0_20_46_8]|nr:MAG: hypothetical protein COV82_03605 [Candidatus Peregrinibacteria bacterium CG11_big_fil_rev_8_21_14_0_20_46_8]